MPTSSQAASKLLALPWFFFLQDFSFTKTVITLVVLGLLYQLVNRRSLYTQTRPGYLLWWGGMVLLSWVLLICFAIEAKWLWHFFFG